MKFHTFRIIAAVCALAFLIGGSCLCAKSCSSSSSAPRSAYTPPPAPQPYQAPPIVTPPPSANAPIYNGSTGGEPSLATIKGYLDAFLRDHGQNRGRTQWIDCIPSAPFRATAVKFNPGDHARYSSTDQSLWSQIRLDFNRDGRDDAKVLLKNNVPYKLEHLGPDGKSTVGSPQFF